MSELQLSPTLRRILLEAVILCAFAAAVGLSLNYQMVMKAFTGKTVAVPKVAGPPAVDTNGAEPVAPQAFPEPVELDELDELLAAGALLIDARNAIDYGKSHLQGAVSLPLGELDTRLADFLTEVSKDRPLIAYCNGFGCPDSFDLGVRLLQEGFQEVLVFEGGYPQWRDAGRPLEEGQ